jgi:hypothetical protein
MGRDFFNSFNISVSLVKQTTLLDILELLDYYEKVGARGTSVVPLGLCRRRCARLALHSRDSLLDGLVHGIY